MTNLTKNITAYFGKFLRTVFKCHQKFLICFQTCHHTILMWRPNSSFEEVSFSMTTELDPGSYSWSHHVVLQWKNLSHIIKDSNLFFGNINFRLMLQQLTVSMWLGIPIRVPQESWQNHVDSMGIPYNQTITTELQEGNNIALPYKQHWWFCNSKA